MSNSTELNSNIKHSKEYIVSFDIGKKNFAFVIEKLNTKSLEKLSKQSIIPKKSRYHDNKSPKELIGTPTKSFDNILESLYQMNNIVLISNNDLTTDAVGKTILEEQIYLNMYEVLTKYNDYWDKCAVILIEKQMSFGTGKQNTMAMKLAQHCYSYFIYRYKGNGPKLIEFSAYLKTQLLGAPKHFGTITKHFKNGKTKEIKDNRKKWATRLAMDILNKRNDTESLESIDAKHEYKQQQDDMSDCLLMNQAYCLMTWYG